MLMGVVLCVSLCVGFVVVAVLYDVDPVAESIFAGELACAAVGEMRCHVEGNMRVCVCQGGCEVAADENCAVKFSDVVGLR